ncbi:LexA family protein [Pseudoflavonifractor phocaeensis]|uniref:LexA family protein n=1 Tax=Pseudoflavonifractor phocaeensis TaxID=1870988 RepID=UPI001F21205D|nr:S24 family peptidase [Pseudoflavonifractor phocaeensis]MCF2662329.1 helix-turn-helix domain-containing protein [Pseudoflavonifractor phocaeensis]
MKKMSIETMENIISYVDLYFCDKHTTPSVNEIALGVGIPKTTAFRYLVEMDSRGMIEYDGKSRTIRTPMINKFAPESAPCPLVGSIPCGTAEEEVESIREYISLPVSLFGKGKFYILEASGDSMVDAGIDDGDMVVIRTDCDVKVGDIVVALTGDNENTLKVYGGIDEETLEARLLYRNEAVYPGEEIRVKYLTVQGVAKHVIKALGPNNP